MEQEIFPENYDTHEQHDLAQEWAEGFDSGYRQAEADYQYTIQELETKVFELQDMVQSLLSKRN